MIVHSSSLYVPREVANQGRLKLGSIGQHVKNPIEVTCSKARQPIRNFDLAIVYIFSV